jgi:F-type H+-transporting ATPase subunit epsilon
LSLKLTAVDGELGILPGHAPLATRLAPAPIRFTLQSGEEVKVDGGEGFLIVSNDTASILLKSQRI